MIILLLNRLTAMILTLCFFVVVAIIATLSAVVGVTFLCYVAVVLCEQSRKSKGQRGQSSATRTRYEIILTYSIFFEVKRKSI